LRSHDRRRANPLGAALAALVLVLLVVLAAPVARAQSDTASPPPGANNWACHPSAEHPDPVVLVHGTGATMAWNWAQLSPKLVAAGYCVFALDYGRRADVPPPFNTFGGIIPMEQSAVELGAVIDQVLSATGAAKVDIVGHSQGSLMPNYYAKYLGGGPKIGRYIGITPLWNGSTAGGLASLYEGGRSSGLSQLLLGPFCQSCAEFFPGSDFITTMNAGGGPRVDGIAYTMLMTRNDEAVTPYTSGYMDGATNIVVQDVCPGDLSEHIFMAVDAVVHQLVLNALDPAHGQPVVCGNPITTYFG